MNCRTKYQSFESVKSGVACFFIRLISCCLAKLLPLTIAVRKKQMTKKTKVIKKAFRLTRELAINSVSKIFCKNKVTILDSINPTKLPAKVDTKPIPIVSRKFRNMILDLLAPNISSMPYSFLFRFIKKELAYRR